ncbi:hypothetical protein AMAG_05099 [Allomyces macrogynus ATCC 38327]|uniref:Uncharacterized protein n=1 Tax=Allomyces macrogynus (strain ATCC 38327) TaxID=578462 RepID=A0A0L0S788_ALLM3|nr:hypothetical protein AMAG_05099 [Allomyces macrogynus ATCC 38327]|eukprot:KNE58290.1 hypothetical protein AMAG_05099 [Allomyces macrogynus ATCC 38327]
MHEAMAKARNSAEYKEHMAHHDWVLAKHNNHAAANRALCRADHALADGVVRRCGSLRNKIMAFVAENACCSLLEEKKTRDTAMDIYSAVKSDADLDVRRHTEAAK